MVITLTTKSAIGYRRSELDLSVGFHWILHERHTSRVALRPVTSIIVRLPLQRQGQGDQY